MDLRKTALTTCIGSVLGAALPVWDAAHRTLRLADDYPTAWSRFAGPYVAFGVLFSAILPVFFFAVYQNEGSLRFSRNVRLISLVAALAVSALLLAQLPAVLSTVRPSESVLLSGPNPFTLANFGILACQLASLTYVALLVAFFLQKNDDIETPVSVSKFLNVMTTVALIAYGVLVAVNIFRVAISPYIYSQAVQHTGRQDIRYLPLLTSILQGLLTQSCLFAAPFAVWNAIRDARNQTQDSVDAPVIPSE